MQGGQSCCFQQAAAMLSFSCISVWSAPPPARWGNSVLNPALCPRDQIQDPPPALTWEIGLSSQPHFSLCAFADLCWVLVAPLGGWFVIPLPLSAVMPLPISAGCWQLLWVISLSPCLHCQPLLLYVGIIESLALRVQLRVPPLSIQHWEFGSLPHPILWDRFSVPPPLPLSVLDCSLLFIFFSFAGAGISIFPGAALDYFLWGEVGKRAMHGAWWFPVPSAVSHRQLWSQLAGRNGPTVCSWVQCREAFHGLGSRMSQSLILFDAHVLLVRRRQEKKERSGQGLFSLRSEAEHALLIVPGGIFMSVRCS
jgi:hypothetical protein